MGQGPGALVPESFLSSLHVNFGDALWRLLDRDGAKAHGDAAVAWIGRSPDDGYGFLIGGALSA